MDYVTGLDYTIHAHWGPRAETPEQIAARFFKMVDRLQAIDPVFALWTFGRRKRRHLEAARDAFVAEVKNNVTRIADGNGNPKILSSHGYGCGAITRGQPHSRSFAALVFAGARRTGWALPNSAQLSTFSRAVPDPASISYALTRELLFTVAEVWDALFCESYPHRLLDPARNGSLRPNWMTYLCPDLAARIDRPSDLPVVEATADGGLLLAATTETFSVENPDHVAAAQRLADATEPLNMIFPRGLNAADAEYED